MPDREDVIWHLKNVQEFFNCTGFAIYADLVSDAIALLKEQEPVEPKRDSYLNWRCGNCNSTFEKHGGDKYCPNCGRAVKWDA